jgi:hypothetical protein
MVRRGPKEGAVERDRVVRIGHDCNGDKASFADATTRGVEIDPAGARQIDLRPGMGRPASGAARGLGRIVERDREIAGRKSRGETERTRPLDHQHGKIAAAAVSKPERLYRLLDSLGFPPSVEEAMVDASGEPGEKLESADRPTRGQELMSPAANLVFPIGLTAFDAVSEVGHLVSAVVDRESSCGVREVKVGGI